MWVHSSKDVFIKHWTSASAGEVKATVYAVGWNEKFIVAQRTNSTPPQLEWWIIDKAQQKTSGPFSPDDFSKVASKYPQIGSINIKMVADLPVK